MNAIIAAAGTARDRFALFGTITNELGLAAIEYTQPNSSVRVGVVSDGSQITRAAVGGNGVLALMGSGLLNIPDLSVSLIEKYLDSPKTLMENMPDDVTAICSYPDEGRLVLGAGIGNHRLFTAEVPGGIMVSSHLALLVGAFGSSLRLDRRYEDFLLGFGFLPNGLTPYFETRVRAGGTFTTWPGMIEGEIVRTAEPAENAIEDIAGLHKRLHHTFDEVLEDQVGPRRRHAVLLGGFDSALVAAGLRRLGHEVDTYTFDFGDARFEQRHAGYLSDYIGARHIRVRITPDIIGAGLEQFDSVFSQPSAQPHYQLHTLHGCRILAQDGHTHVFTGDGCDAAFLGYPTVNRRARLVNTLALLPKTTRRALLTMASTRTADRIGGHVTRLVRSTLASLDLPWPGRGHLPTQYLDGLALSRLRGGPGPEQREAVSDTRIRLASGLTRLDPVRLAFHGNGLTGQSKTKVEGCVADTGVAQLSPYLHPRLRSLAARLPTSLLRPARSRAGAPGKAILMDLARERNLLPEAVINMRKQSPSDSPIDSWYAGPLRPLVSRLLQKLPFECDWEYIDEIMKPKKAEDFFRDRVSLSHHAFQAIGLLCSYATFTRRAL